MSKVRSDSLLKNLPETRQEQIIEWCDTPKTESCVGGYQFAREQLAADGVKVSLRALSDFWSWWNLRQDLKASADVETAMLEANPEAVKEARAAGELMFLKLSMVRQDTKAFSAAVTSADTRRNLDLQEETGRTRAAHKERSLAQKDEDLRLAREKFEIETCEKIIQAARDPKTRQIVEDTTLSKAEMIAQLRQTYFADIDALQASGKVVLPE